MNNEFEEKDSGFYALNKDAICQDCKRLIYGMIFFKEGKMLCTFCHEKHERIERTKDLF